MSSFFQMGHNTENLVGERGLEEFSGIIISPVNRSPEYLISSIPKLRKKGEFEIVFDPQFYFPKSGRGTLQEYPYFPKNFDTSDYTSIKWWSSINKSLIEYVSRVDINSVCSPGIMPKIFNEDYYNSIVIIGEDLIDKAPRGINIYLTSILSYSQLSSLEVVYKYSSILSRTSAPFIYLVIESEVVPRLEFSDIESLKGVLLLINLLEKSGKNVTVAFSSSDMTLFKFAGATNCATNKFFNLRRFTKNRFDEPSEGGGQIEYWFEQSFMAFLRGSDVRRLQSQGFGKFIKEGNSDNIWSNSILNKFTSNPQDPWLGDSWRQYLCWFGKTEAEISNAADKFKLIEGWLLNSEKNWEEVKSANLFFDETKNNGSWIRPWLNSLYDLNKTLQK